jgi:HD-GYP domain-containing protein (c-di-GMP phosphodiesterase class II)
MVTSYSDLSGERLKALQSMFDAIAERQPLDVRQLLSLVAGFIVAFRREYNPLMALTPIRNMDDYTFTHSLNVGILNIAQGMSLGISGELLHDLAVAGMLHDAGKIFVDRAIIQKPGKLTDEEFAAMKTHPVRGAQYLLGQEGVTKLAVISAFEHHMRFDLQGYPSPPAGWQLNLCSQMTMISDTFDALRTRRIYKDPWDFPAVCGHMLTLAGSQLNEDLTINFLDLLARLGDGLPPAQLDDSVPARGCYCE